MTDRTDLPVLLLYNMDSTWTPLEIEEGFQEAGLLESVLREQGHPVKSAVVYNADVVTSLRGHDPNEQIVFNWCEGIPGVPHSEALIAEVLEALNFAYTGSPPAVLALSQDKRQIKMVLERCAVPTPPWCVYKSLEPAGWDRFPAIVKPAQEHCSLGVTSEAVVTTPAELRQRMAYVLGEFKQPALVEEFIDGREFHVTLWGNGCIEMLPPVEIDFGQFSDVHDRLCSYDFKFVAASPHYKKIDLMPAELSQAEFTALEKTTTAAYRAIGCRDYARLDVRLRDGVFYVLDVNPNAGISLGGSLSYAARMGGYSYGAMGSRMVNLAAARHPTLGYAN
jgi:D-alanine-D-alanine ligase